METQPGCERFSSLYCLHTFYRLHATSNGGSESIIQLIAFMDYWRNWFQKTKMPWREGAAFPEVWTGNEKKELTAMMKCVGKLSTDDGCYFSGANLQPTPRKYFYWSRNVCLVKWTPTRANTWQLVGGHQQTVGSLILFQTLLNYPWNVLRDHYGTWVILGSSPMTPEPF